jgi:hypothetical protein
MVFNCLNLSRQFAIDYIEVSEGQRSLPAGYDFYFFNYHPVTMGWLDTSKLKKMDGLVMTMVLEVLPDDPFVMCPDNHFHGYCVLDPTIKSKKKKVFAFPRPLELPDSVEPYREVDIPVIGSFGFATRGKGFQHVVEAVNKEFDRARVRINIPYGDFVPESKAYAGFLAELCRQKAKPGIDVVVTHDYLSKKDLISWCAQNTLNCFLYDRDIPGLAATTDQAIVSGRPLSVSRNETFRHILAYLDPYPVMSLKEAIESSRPRVKKMQEDWSPRVFCSTFEDMLSKLAVRHPQKGKDTGDFVLPLLKKGFSEAWKRKYRKYKRYFRLKKLKRVLSGKRKVSYEEFI